MKDYYKFRKVAPAEAIAQRIEGAHDHFLGSYKESSGVRHGVSRGTQRENPIKGFFNSLLPGNLSATSGEIIDTTGSASSQSDLIVYRASDGIPIFSEEPTILQVESVIGLAEVKSKITADEYKDCIRKMVNLHKLKPFGKELQKYERGRNPDSESCRIFTSIFAYSSDVKGGLIDEYARFMRAADELGFDARNVDRIYILGKGVINPSDKRYAEDRVDRKIGLFYYYSNFLQFAMREVERRKEVPYLLYFGRMSEGWKRI